MEYLSRTYPSTGGERISPSSLLPEHLHHRHIRELQNIPVNWDIADYCIQFIIGILAPYRRDTEAHRLKSVFFGHVAANVLSRPEVGMSTILVALCFIQRISWGFQNHLDTELEKPWDGEDLLLGALITANKSLNDSVWSFKGWSEWTKVLSTKTLQKAERNFLKFIDYNIRVSEAELLAHYDGIMEYCVRKQGGWYGLMNVGNHNPRPQRVESPKAYPVPIGSGRPRATTPQHHPAPPARRQEESYPQAYPQSSHPPANAPAPLPPVPPAFWQPDAGPSQPSYRRPDRERSRSPPRRSRAPPSPPRVDPSWKRPAYNCSAPYPSETWDRYKRSNYRVRYPREHVLDRDDEPRSRRTHRYPSRAPYDGDRYHRRSRGRDSPDARLPPLHGLHTLHDLPDDRPYRPHALLLDTSAGNRRYEDPRSRPTPFPPRPYYWHDGWYQR
ncbi:hypothetical protein FOMPIDRAFT_91777 [Fomitopsis schrenkii]|uniref:Cyclin N-terminal domain-containing protein n=1 Tax=Fomitopsis schrenkii TaxID=2126942 RepID=S8FY65_FOMSC|nr:hypothetical protein FOMPIDRAFT_91777 [Fomitopsis schrenkii]